MWPKETIPDEDFLYMRVHRVHCSDGELEPDAFKDHQGGMSGDWSKYSTVLDTLERATSDKNDNGVIQLNCGHIRAIPPLIVDHQPEPKNRAHTEVMGKKNTKVRLALLRKAEWVRRLPPGRE